MGFVVQASVTLSGGEVVRHRVESGPNETREQVEERARREFETLLASPAYDGRETVDLGSTVEYVTDDTSTANPRDFVRNLPVGNLVMNNVVRLFGAPPVAHAAAGDARTGRMWAPIQNVTDGGRTYTVYREANYINARGEEAGGRLVRVPHGPGGEVQIRIDGTWRRLYDYTGDAGANPTPGGLVPNSELAPVSDTALVPMSPGVPGGIVLTDDDLFFAWDLRPVNQQHFDGRLYDVYEAAGPGGNTTTWRRLHEGSERPWEFRQPDGSWTRASGLVGPEIGSVVRSTPPGWRIETRANESGYTYYTESAGNHRTVRVSNSDGAVQVREGTTFRAAAAADGLPSFRHFPLGGPGSPSPSPTALPTLAAENRSQTVTDRGTEVDMTFDRFEPHESTPGRYWAVFRGENNRLYRRLYSWDPAQPTSAPQAVPGTLTQYDTGGGRWRNVSAARPASAGASRPRGGGGVASRDPI